MQKAPSMEEQQKYDWPGWPLESNPHGEDFDIAARKRMVLGSIMLLPYLRRYKKEMGKVILEVGPFFNPLVTPLEFPEVIIFYWENDHHVLRYLKNRYQEQVYPIFCDLNKIEGDSLMRLKLETQRYCQREHLKKIAFDSVVISHVFNYIDYKLFLLVMKEFLKKDGLLFINNVVDYGLPAFFSERRPTAVSETLKAVKGSGYKILHKKMFDSSDSKHQKNRRLVVVARSNER
ncbi:MAG: hypothetical protein HYV34_01660 [Candidatus Kerfeldbacteria bacterium]|nr:hypothetical protein [Candidatus Kerfeldbacteria bacterium]